MAQKMKLRRIVVFRSPGLKPSQTVDDWSIISGDNNVNYALHSRGIHDPVVLTEREVNQLKGFEPVVKSADSDAISGYVFEQVTDEDEAYLKL